MTASPGRPAVSEAKTSLRRRIRAARRRRLPERDVEAEAEALADAITDLVARLSGGRGCVVATYESLPTEPPTHRVVERLAAAGHRVLVPVTLPDRDLDWRGAGPDTGPEAGAYLGLDAIADADVIVVPALAVDRAGARLGQGGGSYDRSLVRRSPRALVVALVHDDELLEAGVVPVDEHDVGVQVAVTPASGAVSLTLPG